MALVRLQEFPGHATRSMCPCLRGLTALEGPIYVVVSRGCIHRDDTLIMITRMRSASPPQGQREYHVLPVSCSTSQWNMSRASHLSRSLDRAAALDSSPAVPHLVLKAVVMSRGHGGPGRPLTTLISPTSARPSLPGLSTWNFATSENRCAATSTGAMESCARTSRSSPSNADTSGYSSISTEHDGL